jgi:hypothetical protein
MTLSSGGYVVLLSALPNDTPVANDEFLWTDQPVCSDAETADGFVVRAGTSTGSENHDFIVLCDGSAPSGGTGGSAKRRRRRKTRRQAARNDKKKN